MTLASEEGSMANKIPLWTVVQKIQTGKITEREVRQYFVVEPNHRQPFDFVAGFNTDRVDVGNIENTGRLADPLMRGAGTVIDLRHAKPKKRVAKFKRKLPLIAEGDSWFRLPSIIYPRTLIDFLRAKYPIINLADWGDELAEMLLKGEFWPYLDTDTAASDVLLFSAGGNDILGGGELWRFLNLFDIDHDRPSDAPYYVKQEFYDNLEIVVRNYEYLIQQMQSRKHTKNVMIVGHGYDYVIPQRNGYWLGDAMLRQGLDPVYRSQLCRAIIRVMIDAFNVKLGILESRYQKNFKYVNLRNVVKPNEWFDELHARESGARKLAAKFAIALEALPAAHRLPPPVAQFRPRLLRAA
jgi:hypothetical protein